MEWESFNLNNQLVENLKSQFKSPTEIQEKVLVYASSKVDLIIQARTGEGKTLCYGIPICNYILNFYERSEEMIHKISPVALIIVPTRELSIQVKKHLDKILIDNSTQKSLYKIKVLNLLGGMAIEKQKRELSRNPEILISTPGRLWELIEREESEILERINKLKFFVIDEADRMTETGHFKELKNIIDYIYSRIEIKEDEQKENAKEKISKIGEGYNPDEDLKENEFIAKKLGVDLSNIETVDPIQLMKENSKFEDINIDEEEEEDKNVLNLKKIRQEKKKLAEEKIEYTTKVGMRTILCSATIDQIHKQQPPSKKGKNKKQKISTEEEHFQNLIKNLKFYNKLIYLKLKGSTNLLSSESDKGQLDESEPSILPSKLYLDCYKCDASTKDYYLYYLLRENQNKKIIIFTNSISHTKKLFSIFSYFSEFKCTCLHSKMLQSARLKNLERFSSNETPILFCTDIGARGLDVPSVDLVIHYHIPQKSETFIHRSGRTARANTEGQVSSLISEKELGLYKKIMIDLQYKEFSMKTLSVNQLEKIKSLFEYAKQIERESFQLKKANREKQWYQKTAEQCEMFYDNEEDREDEIEDKEAKMNEKLLNKKRKLLNKEKFQRKKIYTKLNESSIKRSSFLTPEQVNKLNKLMEDDAFKNENITQALYEANNDARAIRFKDKPKKRRYMNRRKGK